MSIVNTNLPALIFFPKCPVELQKPETIHKTGPWTIRKIVYANQGWAKVKSKK